MRVWLRFVLSIVLFAVGGAAVADEQRRVLVVLSGVDQVPELPVPTGNYLLEVGVPVMRLRAAGYAVDFVSPDGGPVLVRGNIAYGFADDRLSNPVLKAFDAADLVDERLPSTLAPVQAAGIDYAAVFYVGSLGALLDLAGDRAIGEIAGRVHARGGVVAASGHGVAGLLAVPGQGATLWVAGRRLAVFRKSEDVDFFIDYLKWTLPAHVEDLLRDAGAVLDQGEDAAVHVVADDRVLTGQNAASVDALVDALIVALAGPPLAVN